MSEKEINLIDIFITLRDRKWIILFSIIFALILMYINLESQKTKKIIAKVQIQPISLLEESKYKVYNSFVRSLRPYSMEDGKYYNSTINELGMRNYLDKEIVTVPQTLIYELPINNVNKDFLFDFFIDLVSSKSVLLSILEQTSVSDKYYKDFVEMSLNSKIIKKKDNISIELKVDSEDKKKLFNYINLLEKNLNSKIYQNLNSMFLDYMNFIEEINKIRIEDLTNKMKIALDNEKKIIKRRLELVKNDKYVARLKKKHSESPLSNQDLFHSARLMSQSIIFESKNQNKLRSMILAGIMGLLSGILISLMLNAITKRT